MHSHRSCTFLHASPSNSKKKEKKNEALRGWGGGLVLLIPVPQAYHFLLLFVCVCVCPGLLRFTMLQHRLPWAFEMSPIILFCFLLFFFLANEKGGIGRYSWGESSVSDWFYGAAKTSRIMVHRMFLIRIFNSKRWYFYFLFDTLESTVTEAIKF